MLDSTLPRDQVVYLLQEDERMFYPWGDDRLLCQETLAEPDLAVVVNTRRLLDHLTTSGAITVADATSFEPAFPGIEPARREPGAKRQLFFYSRPENARNLFWRGGLALSRAIEKRVLDPEVWDFHFVGRSTPEELTLPGEVAPQVHEGLPWAEYQDLVSRMDAALVLMDTPHPSYPPYDLAAAGAAVLTNTHGSKTDLSDISANILTAPSSVDGLAEGLAGWPRWVRTTTSARATVPATASCAWDVALDDVVGSLVARYAPVLGGSSDVH